MNKIDVALLGKLSAVIVFFLVSKYAFNPGLSFGYLVIYVLGIMLFYCFSKKEKKN